MKKKPLKRSTLFNLKGILILLMFGIWVNLIIEVNEEVRSLEDFISTYGGNTLLMIIVGYIVLVTVGLFFEASD